MSIVSRNRPPFGEEGYAIVYAGEAVTVGFRLQQPDGAGGYEVQSYTGREFALRVYGDGGATDVNVNGDETAHADGAYIACSLAAADTASLAPGLRGWEFVEYTASGRVVIGAGKFEIALGASAAQSGGSPGSGSSGITLYTLRTDTNIVTVNYMGATGAQPWAAPAAWLTATAYTDVPPRSVVTASGSSYVCVEAHTSGVFATDFSAGKWLLIAAGSGGIGAVSWGDITGTLSAQTDLQSALDAKQASDADLTTIAGLSPTNDDVLQRKSGAWTNRTPTQLKTDLALAKGDVGLSAVDNTADADKPISSATQTALDAKQASDADLTAIAGLSPSNDDLLQRKAGAWANRTPAQVKTDLALVKGDVGLGNVDNTADTAKPVSTATQTALDGKQTANANLTTFAGLTPGADDFLQYKGSAWAARTPAQAKTDLALVKGDVGLGNVDNTADTAKPVSTAQQTALDLKAPIASPTFTGTVAGITKSMVGLGNVDNTSDLNKPISTATQTALDLKQAADADLTAIAALTSAADKLPYATGAGTWALADFTSTGRTLVGGANAPAMRTTLELVIGTDVQAFNASLAAIAAGSWTGATSITTVGTVTTGTWSAKFAPRMSTAASPTSPLTPDSDTIDQYSITGLTTALTINADGGTPAPGQKLIFRIKDNGTARALTWTTGASKAFRPIGVTLPTTTVISKITYVGCIYNATDARWDVVAVVTEA